MRRTFLLPVLTVRVDRLYAWGPKLEETMKDICEGRLSFSSADPLRVSRLDAPRGGFFILDGHYRAIEALLDDQTHVRVVMDPVMPRIERAGGAHRNISVARFVAGACP